jgi:FkbM family methyltransferase
MRSLPITRVALANRVPMLGDVWRFVTAAVAAGMSRRDSYAQHGEDVWLLERLTAARGPGVIYVDVGANHPSRLSNTYLLYRSGFSGVVIEPDPRLVRLHRLFRRRDVAVAAGCGADDGHALFAVSTTPVISSFVPERGVETGARTRRLEEVAIRRLDDILEDVDFDFVGVLSIDTEGFEREVLDGAPATLARTLFVCIERNTDDAASAIADALTGDFECVAHFGCNDVWRNRALADLAAHPTRVRQSGP